MYWELSFGILNLFKFRYFFPFKAHASDVKPAPLVLGSSEGSRGEYHENFPIKDI